jgi:hypothetical protein
MPKQITKVWTFESSSGNGTYETLQYDDGSTSCNCFGWTHRNPPGGRTCKHTRLVDQGIADSECVSSATPNQQVKPLSDELKSTKTKASKAKPAKSLDDAAPEKKADRVARRIIW